MHKSITHKQLAAALKVSRPYITKLVSLGMPTTSVADAKRWLKEQKKASGIGKNAPVNINAARVENILLKNRLLRLEIAEAEDKSELISVDRIVEALKQFLIWSRLSGKQAAELSAESLAAAATPLQAFRIVDRLVEGVLFDGLMALLAGSGFRESDPRLHTLVKEAVADIKGYSEEQTSSFVAGFTEGIARNVDSLAPREILVSKLAVDAAATKTSTMICERLTEFINKVSLRLPGGPTSETYNILLDHLRPALAEIERVVDLFRLEVGCAADLIVKAVDGKCAQFWRHWEQTCRNRAAGLEKRAAA